MPEALVLGALVAVVVAAVVLAMRRARRSPAATEPTGGGATGIPTVRLDVAVEGDDPGPVRRLAAAAAASLFHADRDLGQVEVRDREGALLAIIDRAEGLELADHDPFEAATASYGLVLPPAVLGRLPDEPTLPQLVRALLEAAGHRVSVEDDVLRVGDRAVVALEATDPEALGAAFLRYRASGARTGVVVSRRAVPAAEVRRRELLAPDLRYAGPGALQRMADAVAVGADPIAFAPGPPRSDG